MSAQRIPFDQHSPPARQDGEPEYAHTHRVTLWALANPQHGLYLCSSYTLERMYLHTMGVVQGRAPGPLADTIADLRRQIALTLRVRAQLELEAEETRAAQRTAAPPAPTDLPGGARVPRGDVPPPKAPPTRMPDPVGAL